jgi:flagellar basal body-associated protein FliL
MRQRIVINLDGTKVEGPRAGRKRRRWPRVLGILALLVLIVVVVAVVGGFFWWRYYQSKPVYSVILLVDAAARNDVAEFEKHINEDEIAKNMTTTVSQKAAARYGLTLNSSIQQQIDSRVPSVLPRLKETIRNEVKAGMAFNALAPEGRSFIWILLKVPSLLTLKTEGEIAKVTMPRGDHTIDLTMQRYADGWKMTEFKDELAVQHIVDSVMTELPPIGNIDWNNVLPKKSQRKRAGRGR